MYIPSYSNQPPLSPSKKELTNCRSTISDSIYQSRLSATLEPRVSSKFFQSPSCSYQPITYGDSPPRELKIFGQDSINFPNQYNRPSHQSHLHPIPQVHIPQLITWTTIKHLIGPRYQVYVHIQFNPTFYNQSRKTLFPSILTELILKVHFPVSSFSFKLH